jgi:hypothetical protein
VLLAFERQPWIRGTELDPTLNKLTNSTLLGDSNANGVPDLWTSVAGTSLIITGDECYQNSHTAVSDLITQDFTTGNNTFTLSGYARRISGAGTGVLRIASVGGSGSDDSDPISSAVWQRFTATVTTTGATTAVKASLRQGVASGTTVLQFRNVQLEAGSVATPYRVGVETLNNDPAAAGLGRVVPVYNPGSMPARPRVLVLATMEHLQWGVRSRGPAAGNRSLIGYLNGGKFSQVEGWTLGTDTTATTDANASPQSGNTHAVTTFATSTHILRASTSITGAALEGLKGGTWRVMLRAATSVISSTFSLQLKWKWGTESDETTATEESQVTFAPTTTDYWEATLGTVSFPDVTPDGLELFLFAGRSAGTGSLRSDLVSFVPAESLGQESYGVSVADTYWTELDGNAESSRVLNAGFALTRQSTSLQPITIRGSFPELRPGLNMLHIAGVPDSAYGITAAPLVRVYITPRYHL